MAVKKVHVPDVGMVHFYKRRGAKSIRLSIARSGNVRVSMPPWVPYRVAMEFVINKRAWLQAKRVVRSPLQSGQKIGRGHTLVFTSKPGIQKITTRINRNNEISVTLPAGSEAVDEDAQTAAERACQRALRNEAEIALPPRLRELASQHGFTYQSVSIKRLSSRWGSCSEKKHIVLNSYLIQLPDHLIDYVIMHELLHTKVMAHGIVFWTELARFVPDLSKIRKEIRGYQPVILPV